MDDINIYDNYPTEKNIWPESHPHRKLRMETSLGVIWSNLLLKVAPACIWLLSALSGEDLKVSQDSYHNLSNPLFQCLITLIVKNMFSISIQNFSGCTVYPLPLALLLWNGKKTKSIK